MVEIPIIVCTGPRYAMTSDQNWSVENYRPMLRLAAAIDQLPDPQRTAFLLRQLNNCSAAEIAGN
jgi:DNA-directed RNA polymerase specialized sigma24 family protein